MVQGLSTILRGRLDAYQRQRSAVEDGRRCAAPANSLVPCRHSKRRFTSAVGNLSLPDPRASGLVRLQISSGFRSRRAPGLVRVDNLSRPDPKHRAAQRRQPWGRQEQERLECGEMIGRKLIQRQGTRVSGESATALTDTMSVSRYRKQLIFGC